MSDKPLKIKVIGAGGIGSYLILVLSRFVNFKSPGSSITVVDGDVYEHKNRERQEFDKIGNKAEINIATLKDKFSDIEFHAESVWLTDDTVDYLVEEGDIVFLCVDNHKTRKVISRFCEDELKNIVLISGGNDYTDGNIQVYIKSEGKNITQPLTNSRHPEIAQPADKSPEEMGCEELAASDPQLIFTNLTAATMMLNAFYAYLEGKLDYDEAYFDILTNSSRTIKIEHQAEAVTKKKKSLFSIG